MTTTEYKGDRYYGVSKIGDQAFVERLPNDDMRDNNQVKLAISFEVNEMVKQASLVPRVTFIDMCARIGGVSALLVVIGMFFVVPIIKH